MASVNLPFQPVRMSVERYHKLTEAGAFNEHDHVELLDGVVIEQMAENPRHSIATRRCDLALSNRLPAGRHCQNQEPVTLQNSEPEPDIAIVRGVLENYTSRHPGPPDLELVVEVADTSLVTDRYKAELYAAAGIPVYWIVNLSEQVVEVRSSPDTQVTPAAYRRIQIFTADMQSPLMVAGQEVAHLPVSELL